MLHLLLTASLALGSDGSPNFLVMIGDDIGVDRVGAYAEHPDPGRTPNLDYLASRGLLFRNAYANPVCTPSRATLWTGRYSHRTGVGSNAKFSGSGDNLLPSEVMIEEALAGYASHFSGKWHLVTGNRAEHPNWCGIADFNGSMYNLNRGLPNGNYTNWIVTENGAQVVSNVYATTHVADRTIGAMQSLPEPWIVFASFNAPHRPFHAPPASLHTYDLSAFDADDDADAPIFMRAMSEAMDTEIGRILQAVRPNTYVIFMGDNGTAGAATDAPFNPDHAKASLYEGGINVPLIIAGPGVPTGEVAGLVNSTDLYATILELAGRTSAAEDSVSLVPYFQDPLRPSLRDYAYSEWFGNGFRRQAVRDCRYKLIRLDNAGTGFSEEFYDLELDPFEENNLLEAGMGSVELDAYSELVQQLPQL